MKLHDLPALNATLNGISAGFIILGWIFIKRNQTKAHILMMSCAVLTSTAFLVSYLIYHLNSMIMTKFTATGFVRGFYFTLLITHVILAFTTVPLVLATLVPALQARYDRHRRIATWTLPIWLYVSVTGVLVYLMLYQWYPPTQAAHAP